MRRRLPFLRITLSALLGVLVAQLVLRDWRWGFLALALFVPMAVPPILARRRARKLLLSGDVKQVLEHWRNAMVRLGHPETTAPIMMATAYVSYGWLESARTALSRAVRGPAWNATLEQRLIVEALLDTFEGDTAGAISKALELESMPMPRRAGFIARKRIARLRQGVIAVARAFAHESNAGDVATLDKAAHVSPLLHWAMRYAAAIVAIDHGKVDEARDMLEDAPVWPEESAFRAFHDQITARLAGA